MAKKPIDLSSTNSAIDHALAIIDERGADDPAVNLYANRFVIGLRGAGRVGRARLPEGQTRKERIVAYLWAPHTVAETIEKFPKPSGGKPKASTIERYEKDILDKNSK